MNADRKKTTELRREMRVRLAALAPAEKTAAWSAIFQRLEREWLKELEAKRSGGLVLALFHPLPDELPILDFIPVLQSAFGEGLRLLFPRIEGLDPPSLVFHEARSEDLRPAGGPWNLPEPPATSPVVPLSQADWVWVPGLVFGEGGERIGRGKGFYDRALAAAPGPGRLVTAAEFQVFPSIPQHPGDARMDWIVTEKRLILPACASRQNRA